jgi:hypothetical protein
MQMLWCWRCRGEVPMLDEEEFAEIKALNLDSIKSVKEIRQRTGIPLNDPSIDELFRPVRDRYEQLTGTKEKNHSAILHHRISLYGPPCKRCQKPLRRPHAKVCGSCMQSVEGVQTE